jgi:hypothetical protein
MLLAFLFLIFILYSISILEQSYPKYELYWDETGKERDQNRNHINLVKINREEIIYQSYL